MLKKCKGEEWSSTPAHASQFLQGVQSKMLGILLVKTARYFILFSLSRSVNKPSKKIPW